MHQTLSRMSLMPSAVTTIAARPLPVVVASVSQMVTCPIPATML